MRNWLNSVRSRNVCPSLIFRLNDSKLLLVLGISMAHDSYQFRFLHNHSAVKYSINSVDTFSHFSMKSSAAWSNIFEDFDSWRLSKSAQNAYRVFLYLQYVVPSDSRGFCCGWLSNQCSERCKTIGMCPQIQMYSYFSGRTASGKIFYTWNYSIQCLRRVSCKKCTSEKYENNVINQKNIPMPWWILRTNLAARLTSLFMSADKKPISSSFSSPFCTIFELKS